MTNPLLQVEQLKTYFSTRRGEIRAVDGVSFSVDEGQVLGIVGESGSGKSVTGYSIMGLVDTPGRVVSGSVQLNGRELTGLTERDWRGIRGREIAMIFQDPMLTLNPVLRIDTQIVEAIQAHADVGRLRAREWAAQALAEVGIPSPEERLSSYPHQFSGGMRQRVAIAIALLHKPKLLIADEPTTALDVTIQGQILAQVQALAAQRSVAVIWITHDLSVVSGLAHRIAVMYAGRVVEDGTTDTVLSQPRHPYTHGLLHSLPSQNRPGQSLAQIPGSPPRLLGQRNGCAFASRCPRASTTCTEHDPVATIAAGSKIRCHFPIATETV